MGSIPLPSIFLFGIIMLTINFSQCSRIGFLDVQHWQETPLPQTIYSIVPRDRIGTMPIKDVLNTYRRWFNAYAAVFRDLNRCHYENIYTYDEHLILMAQKYVRDHLIDCKDIELVSWCACDGKYKSLVIKLDEEGDLLDDMHHGFFSQRLEFLR